MSDSSSPLSPETTPAGLSMDPAAKYSDFLLTKGRPKRVSGFEPEQLPDVLFDWQAAVTAWALRHGSAALFEDCGLGKTVQQLAWAHAVVRHTNRPVLILAPLGVSWQTVDEGAKFDLPVERIVHSSQADPVGVYITNYERLNKIDPAHFSGVVLDESSILKDVGSKTRNFLIRAFKDTRFRLSCTATPAPNDFMELGNQSEFLGVMTRASMLSTFFVHDGGSTSKWRLKGHAESAFYDWLASWCMYIRTPRDIGYPDDGYVLPDHTVSVDAIPFSYRPAGLLFDVPATSLNELREIRRESIPARLDRLATHVNGARTLTWCGLNAESSAISEAYPEAVEVKGSDPTEYKEEMLLEFGRGSIQHLITKPSIAGHGMNWQVCNRQVYFGLDHSYERFYQSSRRLVRFGQRQPVQTSIIVTETDRHVVEAVFAKLKRAGKMADHLATRMEASMRLEITGAHESAAAVAATSEAGDGWVFHLGDSVQVITGVADASIGYQIMSIPFPELYTYSSLAADMGNCDWNEFWDHFGYLVPEMLRVSSPGRLATIHCMDLPIKKQTAGYVGLRDFPGEIIRLFERCGWRYFARRMVWKDPVVENARTHSLGHGNLLKDSTKSRAGLPDYLLTFQKPGENEQRVSHDRASFPVEQWQMWASPSWTQRELTKSEAADFSNPPDWMLAPVWYDVRPSDTLQRESAREDRDEKHICPLQLTAIGRCIEMWSNPGDVVASWFGGIGSEGYVAVRKGRQALLCELKRSYWKQGVRNLQKAENHREQPSLPFGDPAGDRD